MDATGPVRLLAGRYRLIAVIGEGGMGVVWRGHDELLDRDVAVKEITWSAHLSEQEQELAKLRATREAQMAGRLSHRNVVRVYDVVEDDGHPCIVMEYLPYKSLGDLLKEEGPLPPAEAAQIGLGVLDALSSAHEEGILHRDVKPANIMVGPDGRVVLTDFGIARAVDSPTLTADGTLLGSPSYTAPERARGGLAGAGPPADLWGLGASLYTAVEGRPPFERNGALATLTAVVADEPEAALHAGPLEPAISGLLRKDPAQRLTAAEARELLRRAAQPPSESPESPDADSTTAAVPGRWRPAAARPRASRGWPLVLAVLVVAAGAVAGLTVALTSAPGRPAASAPGSRDTPSGGPHPVASRVGTTPSAAKSPASTGTPATRTAAPSASTGSGGAAGYGPLPAGYYRFTNSTGFSIGVPNGWQISHQGHYVYITDPADSNIYLLIDQSDQPRPDPLADWEQQQANRKGTYPGYHLISLRAVSYAQAEKAADWEFTYVRDGVPVHILNRNVLANATHAYALYWSTPESDWTADYHYFRAFAATFKPAPGPPDTAGGG